MDIRNIDDRFSVTGQIDISDIPVITAAGFKTIICNRPDNEGADQLPFSVIRDAAQQSGLEFFYIPVSLGAALSMEPQQMAQAVKNSSGPILGYCRSGARAANLYAMSTAR